MSEWIKKAFSSSSSLYVAILSQCMSFLCPKTIHQQSHITIFLASTDINNKSQKGIKITCLPCPASYSTSFDQLFLRVLTPGWHAMCQIVERVPWFGIGSSVLIFSIFWFLILICVLAHASHAMCHMSDNWTYSLSSHKTRRDSSPLIELPTFVKIPSTTYLPFIWEGAILRECHSPARTLADGAVITAPLNHLTLAVMAAREAE